MRGEDNDASNGTRGEARMRSRRARGWDFETRAERSRSKRKKLGDGRLTVVTRVR
ncbi:hypothetical protein N9S31_00810 [bacterium]|nr:hypothetical protein [bacterium]MDA9599347.1 hypothetical protein [bacterium]